MEEIQVAGGCSKYQATPSFIIVAVQSIKPRRVDISAAKPCLDRFRSTRRVALLASLLSIHLTNNAHGSAHRDSLPCLPLSMLAISLPSCASGQPLQLMRHVENEATPHEL